MKTETKKHDWGLIAAGVILLVLAILFVAFPLLTLVTISTIAGCGFLVAGICEIAGYFRLRKTGDPSLWTIGYGALSIIVGLIFLLHPLISAGVISWLVGICIVVFGVFEIFSASKLHKLGMPLWGWMVFSGVVDILCGCMFFAFPETMVIFLALFLMMRGISLIIYGWTAEKSLL